LPLDSADGTRASRLVQKETGARGVCFAAIRKRRTSARYGIATCDKRSGRPVDRQFAAALPDYCPATKVSKAGERQRFPKLRPERPRLMPAAQTKDTAGNIPAVSVFAKVSQVCTPRPPRPSQNPLQSFRSHLSLARPPLRLATFSSPHRYAQFGPLGEGRSPVFPYLRRGAQDRERARVGTETNLQRRGSGWTLLGEWNKLGERTRSIKYWTKATPKIANWGKGQMRS
jgi:hypothetical protein